MSEPASLPDDEREPEPEQSPTMGPVSAGAMTAFGVVGLVFGWSMHRIGDYLWGHAPLVTLSQVLAPYIASVILGIIAWVTWGQVQGGRPSISRSKRSEVGARTGVPLDFQSAVNRLVLARASALIGCLIAGGYLGYAMSWLWIQGDYAVSPAVRSAITGVGGLIMTLTALGLQRACRVRSKDDSDLV